MSGTDKMEIGPKKHKLRLGGRKLILLKCVDYCIRDSYVNKQGETYQHANMAKLF